MNVGKWQKVSQKQFDADGGKDYNAVVLPCRATCGSAGYDLLASDELNFLPNAQLAVASGLRCQLQQGYVILIVPKSGLGTRYNLRLANTVGVIDSDYYGAINEGHIIVNLINGDKPLTIKKGQAYAQAIILPYFTAEEEVPKAHRTGGFGSTGK